MGVFSWFRRREAGAKAIREQGGGTIAVLEPDDRTDQGQREDAGQEPLPGVPAARTAPDAAGGEATGEATGARSAEQDMASAVEPATAVPDGVASTLADVPASDLLAVRGTAARTEAGADSHPDDRPGRPDTGDEAMGLMDSFKGKAEELAEELKEKASHLAGQHNEKIDEVVDKAGEAIDKVTQGRYSDKIAAGTEKAKDAVDHFAEKPAEPGQADASSPDTSGTGQSGTTQG